MALSTPSPLTCKRKFLYADKIRQNQENSLSIYTMLKISHIFSAQTFGESFYADISKVLRFLFHVLSHMYSSHFTHLHKLSMHGHLNIIFMHFVLLVREFELLDNKDLEPLKDLIDLMQISKNKCMEVPSKSSLQSSSPSTSNGSKNPLSHGSANAQTSYNTFSSGQFSSSFGKSSGMLSSSKSYVTS